MLKSGDFEGVGFEMPIDFCCSLVPLCVFIPADRGCSELSINTLSLLSALM